MYAAQPGPLSDTRLAYGLTLRGPAWRSEGVNIGDPAAAGSPLLRRTGGRGWLGRPEDPHLCPLIRPFADRICNH